jgi:hypothetical protein
VEGAQSSLQSVTQRERHRGQSHLQRPVDRLHQSNHIVCLNAAIQVHSCWKGSPISLSWMCPAQEAPITTRAHHCIIQSTTVSGCLRGLHPHGPVDQTPVWKVRFVRFPNAPGGTQDYEVRQPEMERCLMAFKAQLSSNASKVNDPHQKK